MSNARTLGRLTTLNLFNAGLGVLNTVIVAYLFGTSRSVEIYMAAVALHVSLVSLAQTGQVSEVLLPSYHAIRATKGGSAAVQAYSALTNRFLAVLAMIALGGWLLSPLLMRLRVPGFGAESIALAAQMFQLILPLIVIQVAAELLKTLANAERLFGGPETVTLLARVSSLLTLILLSGKMDTWALVASIWCAGVTELVGIVWLLRRRGFRHRLTFALPPGAESVRLFRKLLSTLPYVALTQLYVFVFDAALSHLRQGSFAIYRYAIMIAERSSGIFMRPVVLTFFTDFSEAATARSGTRDALVARAIARSLAITAVVTTAVMSGAHKMLTGLWQGARFPSEQIATLVWVLGGLFVVLPISKISTILRKVTVSLHRVFETYLGLAIVQAISAVAAWQLVTAFGLVGALLTNAVNLVGFCVVPLLVLKAFGSPVHISVPYSQAWRWLVAIGCGLLSSALFQRLVGEIGRDLAWVRVADVALGCTLAGLAVAVTLTVALALRVPEAMQLRGLLHRALSRGRLGRPERSRLPKTLKTKADE